MGAVRWSDGKTTPRSLQGSHFLIEGSQVRVTCVSSPIDRQHGGQTPTSLGGLWGSSGPQKGGHCQAEARCSERAAVITERRL